MNYYPLRKNYIIYLKKNIMLQTTFKVFCIFFVSPEDGHVDRNML